MDRGSKKWQGMMLPEHVEMLKDAEQEQYRKKKPILDEQEWEEIGQKLMEALETGEPVRVTYYNGI